MYITDFYNRLGKILKLSHRMLESRYKDCQAFYQGFIFDQNNRDLSNTSDYDPELEYKLIETEISCSDVYSWFNNDGRFKNEKMQDSVSKLLCYCAVCAENQNPILAQALNALVNEIDKMIPADWRGPISDRTLAA